MKKYFLILPLIFCSCSLIRKDQGSDSLQNISEEVIKKHQGIDIEFKPIASDSK